MSALLTDREGGEGHSLQREGLSKYKEAGIGLAFGERQVV